MKQDKKSTLQRGTGNNPSDVLEFALASYNLMGFARRLTRCPEQAQDLYQDTAERILKYAKRLDHRGDGYTKSWATSIMYTVFINKYRRSKAKSNMETLFYLERSTEVAPDILPETEEIPLQEISEVLIDAMNSLTERQRVATFLFARDFQYKEIADLLQIPMGTVMSTLGRGRKTLRENEQLVEYVRKEYGITAAA